MNGTGPTYGADATFTTPKATPRKLTLKVKPKHPTGSPLKLKLSGKLKLPSGVNTATVCTGTLKLKITAKHHKAKTKRIHLRRGCTYSLKLKLRYGGKGKLHLKLSFPGSAFLGGISKTAKIRFG